MTTSIDFPPGFLWGTAVSAHQVEGDNVHSDWWAYEQVPGHIQRNEKSGRACDHFTRFEEDLDLCARMNTNAFRFSIEWSRIVPREGVIDEAAVDHYHRVLDACDARGIAPFVTAHHFTVPRWFILRGGFADRANLGAWERWCELLADRFGARVRWWCTLNEPAIYAMMSYLFGYFSPGEKNPRVFARVMHNLLTAHAIAYHTLRSANPNARVGLVKNMPFYTPYHPANPFDRLSAWQHDRLYNEFWLGGIRDGRAARPLGDGRVVPGLAGSTDFWGLNYYNQSRCRWCWPIRTHNAGDGHRMTQTAWAPYPPGLAANLARLAKFGLPIYITENGIATDDDARRRAYIIEHLRQVRLAIDAGADVRGYFYWSLLDNFEWEDGWAPKFGLVAVDRETFSRAPKPSADLYGRIAKRNGIDAEWLRADPWDMRTMDRADV